MSRDRILIRRWRIVAFVAVLMIAAPTVAHAITGMCFGDSGSPVLAGDTDTVLTVDSFVNDWSCAGVDCSTRLDREPVLDRINGWG